MLQKIGRQFQVQGDFVQGGPFGSGHINDTYLATYQQKDTGVRYIFQRINDHVFKDPKKLMENVQRVTEHLYVKTKGNGAADPERSCLRLIPAKDGSFFNVDELGKYWRVFRFIEEASTYDVVRTDAQAFEAGAAFARFQKMLVDLPAPRLHEIIPDFHNTEKRYRSFTKAIDEDAAGRVTSCREEIAFAKERRDMAPVLMQLMAQGTLPERITHNDTKLNNVMIDEKSRKGICVVDLDTVMPGTVLNDFGDLVRTSTSLAAEDEKDLEKVFVRETIFEGLARGYLSEARRFLVAAERDNLVFCGKLITFEQGIRFLTDYLQKDKYYKVKHAEHNLDRCRTQFKLVRSIEEKEKQLTRIVNGILENV